MGQETIWSFFQNDGVEAFKGSEQRLTALLHIVERMSGPSNVSLLNIGTGSGFLEASALRKGWTVNSLDPDEKAIRRVNRLGVYAIVGYIQCIPIADMSMDFVVASEVLEHLALQDMKDALSEIARVLKPNGLLIGTVPFKEDLLAQTVVCPCCSSKFHRWGHQQAFDVLKMTSILQQRFSVLKCKPQYYPSWNLLNWKGKLIATVRIVLNSLGSSGDGATLMFVAQKQCVSGCITVSRPKPRDHTMVL